MAATTAVKVAGWPCVEGVVGASVTLEAALLTGCDTAAAVLLPLKLLSPL
jgi:hypothetical protein